MKIFNFVILVSFCVLNAQSSQRDYNEELRYQNDAINKMKKEIEELSSKLRKANINETTTSKRITNLDEEAKKFPIIAKTETGVTLNTVMSNSFGFGGTNAALIFEKV